MNAHKTEAMLATIDATLLDEEDRVLLKSAGTEKVQRVDGSAGQQSGANRSADSRAWTMGGRVD